MVNDMLVGDLNSEFSLSLLRLESSVCPTVAGRKRWIHAFSKRNNMKINVKSKPPRSEFETASFIPFILLITITHNASPSKLIDYIYLR